MPESVVFLFFINFSVKNIKNKTKKQRALATFFLANCWDRCSFGTLQQRNVMRKLLRTLAFGAMTIAFSVAASASEITTSVNAADISDFSTADTVFGADGITLTVSSDSTGYRFVDKISGATSTIDIASGAKLTVTNNGGVSKPLLDFTKSTLNVNGEGTFYVKNSGEVFIRGKVLNFNANTQFDSRISILGTSVVNINNNFKAFSFSGQPNITLNINKGTTNLGDYAQWGYNSQANVASGATLIATGGLRVINSSGGLGALTQSMNIGGTVSVSSAFGTKGWNGTYGVAVSMFASNLTVNKGGSLTIFNSDANKTKNNVIAVALSNAGTISLDKKLYMANNTTLSLKEGSNLSTEGRSSQAYSYIDLANVVYIDTTNTAGTSANSRPVVLAITDSKVTAANVTFNIEGAQELGGVRFYKDSKLTLNFAEGSSFAVNEFLSIDDYEGDFIINLTGDWGKNNFKINDMSENRINKIKFMHDGVEIVVGKDYELVADTASGMGYWFNAIPEPSTYAAILGGLAIAFAFMRKTRKGA